MYEEARQGELYMGYYVLTRTPPGELYSINLTLPEDEARRYGYEGEMVPVTALVVWTEEEKLQRFRRFLSVKQENPHSPLAELFRDMQDERVDVIELDSVGLWSELRRLRLRIEFVLLNPGPEQDVVKVGEIFAHLGVDPADRQGIDEPDKKPERYKTPFSIPPRGWPPGRRSKVVVLWAS